MPEYPESVKKKKKKTEGKRKIVYHLLKIKTKQTHYTHCNDYDKNMMKWTDILYKSKIQLKPYRTTEEV